MLYHAVLDDACRMHLDAHMVDHVHAASAAPQPYTYDEHRGDACEHAPDPHIHRDHLLGLHPRHTPDRGHANRQNSPIAIPRRR